MQALHEKENMQHVSFTSKTTLLTHKDDKQRDNDSEEKETELIIQKLEHTNDILIQSITSVPMISPSLNCEHALELFRENPKHECIVIVDEGQQPIGLVMRNALFIKLSLPLVRELYSQRPIIKLTDTNPLIVDVHTELYDVVKQALSRTGTHLYDCVIVCDDKCVKGVLTMSDLLKLSTALQDQSKEAQYHLISSSKRTIKRIVEEVEQVHAAVQVSEQKSESMVDMTLEGKNMLQKLTDTVAIISSNAKQQQTQMEQLQLSATTIQNVTKLVQEMSEQSNLLAINASIEAARAGAHGRSFGVVATEMMNLASQTKRYAVQIKEAIEQIVTAIHDTKQLTERGAIFSLQSDEMITNAESIFQELFKMVAQNKQELHHIDQQAQLANEQAQATMNELSKLSELHK